MLIVRNWRFFYFYLHMSFLFCTFAPKLAQNKLNKRIMSCLQVLLAIIFPPLAVVDRGCGSVAIVFLLTLCGWIPGVIGALIILNKNN